MKAIMQKDIHTHTFMTTLFTTAKIWRQPKRPSTDEWIQNMWCIHTQDEILLSHEKDEILPFMTRQMDFEGIMISEMSDGERQIPYDFIHM